MKDFDKYEERLYRYYRSRFIKIVKLQDSDLRDDLIDIQDEIESAIRRNSSGGQIDESSIDKPIKAILLAGIATLYSTMVKRNVQVATTSGEWGVEMVKPYENDYFATSVEIGTENLVDSIRNRLQYRTFPADDVRIGSRIRTLQGSTLKAARNLIAVGIKEGQSAGQIAGALSNFVLRDRRQLWTSPFEWYRERFGVKRTPNDIRAGSLDYNFYRIARTEINYTWRYATVRLHDGKSYMEGWEWRLSGSHPKPDICDDWAEASPYKNGEGLPEAHPHCMCSVVPILVNPERMQE